MWQRHPDCRLSILSQVRKTIRRDVLFSRGEHVGVGVSGGVDSVCLLDILFQLKAELGISLAILHLNHGIRGEEAERDERFVRGLSERYGVPFIGERVDCPAYQAKEGLSPQEAARELRYHFFAQAMQRHGIKKVALGHTADDQAETILVQLLRGGGLRGIPPVRGVYVRPLLEVWRQDLMAYADGSGLSYVEDSSNLKGEYLRNRIRHELIPILQGYNPAIKQRLVRLAQVIRSDAGYLDLLADRFSRLIKQRGDGVCISIPSLLSLPQALQARVLQRAFGRLPGGRVLAYPHIVGVMRMIEARGRGKMMRLPGGHWARVSGDTLLLIKEGVKAELDAPVEVSIPGRTALNALGKAIEAELIDGCATPQADPECAWLDYEKLVLPLRVRTFRPGDRFIPLGMKGEKKLSDFFIDLKVPREQRGRIPLVISGGEICWVAGFRVAEGFRVRAETKKTLLLRLVSS